MAAGHGSKAKLFANGYDLTGFLTAVSTEETRELADASTLGDTGREFIPGLLDGTVSLEGNYDAAAAAVDEVLHAALAAATKSVITYLPQGDAFGNAGVACESEEASYAVTTDIADVGKVSSGFQADKGIDRVLVLHQLQTEAAAGNSASHDNAGGTTNGGVGYLQSIGTGPIAAVTVKVQHSTDNIAFPDLITFSAFTDRAKQRSAVSGTVNRYTRSQWNAGSTIPFHVAFARK